MTKTVSTKSTTVTSATTTVISTIMNVIILRRFVVQIDSMTWTFEMAPVIMTTKTTIFNIGRRKIIIK